MFWKAILQGITITWWEIWATLEDRLCPSIYVKPLEKFFKTFIEGNLCELNRYLLFVEVYFRVWQRALKNLIFKITTNCEWSALTHRGLWGEDHTQWQITANMIPVKITVGGRDLGLLTRIEAVCRYLLTEITAAGYWLILFIIKLLF